MNNNNQSSNNQYPEFEAQSNIFDRLFQKARGVEMLPENKVKGLEKLKLYIKANPAAPVDPTLGSAMTKMSSVFFCLLVLLLCGVAVAVMF
jgi:hypothetical protein